MKSVATLGKKVATCLLVLLFSAPLAIEAYGCFSEVGNGCVASVTYEDDWCCDGLDGHTTVHWTCDVETYHTDTFDGKSTYDNYCKEESEMASRATKIPVSTPVASVYSP
jgi:hypothetical protein